MGKIAADPGSLHERLLGVGQALLTGDIIDVAMYPFQYRHDLGDPVVGAGELPLGKPRELVDGQKRLGSRNGWTSLESSDHNCCRPNWKSNWLTKAE